MGEAGEAPASVRESAVAAFAKNAGAAGETRLLGEGGYQTYSA